MIRRPPENQPWKKREGKKGRKERKKKKGKKTKKEESYSSANPRASRSRDEQINKQTHHPRHPENPKAKAKASKSHSWNTTPSRSPPPLYITSCHFPFKKKRLPRNSYFLRENAPRRESHMSTTVSPRLGLFSSSRSARSERWLWCERWLCWLRWLRWLCDEGRREGCGAAARWWCCCGCASYGVRSCCCGGLL